MKKICLWLCSRFPFVRIFLFCHKMQILLFRLSYFSSVRKNILNTFSRQTNHTMQIVDNSNIFSWLLANYYFRYHKFKLYNKLTILYFKKSALPGSLKMISHKIRLGRLLFNRTVNDVRFNSTFWNTNAVDVNFELTCYGAVGNVSLPAKTKYWHLKFLINRQAMSVYCNNTQNQN